MVKTGDRVCFCNGGIGGTMGTYAEAAVVPEWQLARVPDAVDDLTAAALPLVSITCWESLYDRARVQAGEFVLIHGGAGGTGHVAVQLAAPRGCPGGGDREFGGKGPYRPRTWGRMGNQLPRDGFRRGGLDWSGGINVAFDNAGAEVMQRTFAPWRPMAVS